MTEFEGTGTPISEEMAHQMANAEMRDKVAMQGRRLVKEIELWPYETMTTNARRKYVVGTMDPKITVLDGMPGQINVTYENGDIQSIFYDIDRYELRVLHEEFIDPLITVPTMVPLSDITLR